MFYRITANVTLHVLRLKVKLLIPLTYYWLLPRMNNWLEEPESVNVSFLDLPNSDFFINPCLQDAKRRKRANRAKLTRR